MAIFTPGQNFCPEPLLPFLDGEFKWTMYKETKRNIFTFLSLELKTCYCFGSFWVLPWSFSAIQSQSPFKQKASLAHSRTGHKVWEGDPKFKFKGLKILGSLTSSEWMEKGPTKIGYSFKLWVHLHDWRKILFKSLKQLSYLSMISKQ